jgi:NTE family protein
MPNSSSQEARTSSHRRALVLSGGGIKGAFQAGAIAEVLSQGFEPDILIGTSIGALNAAFLADRVGRSRLANQPVDWAKVGASLEAFWSTKITGPDCIIGKKTPTEIGVDIARKRFSGFVGIDPAAKIARDEIHVDNVRASKLTIQVATVNVADGVLVLADSGYPDFVEYVIASSAMPLVMPLKNIGGALYTDGGIRHVAPVQAAIKLHADEIICIVCQAEKLAALSLNAGNIFQLGGQLMDIITNALVTNDLDQLQRETMLREELLRATNKTAQRRVSVYRVIRPAAEITADIESFTSKDIKEMISTGHAAAAGRLIPPALFTFTVG